MEEILEEVHSKVIFPFCIMVQSKRDCKELQDGLLIEEEKGE